MDKEISYIITEYSQKLKLLGIKIKRVILYGSYVWWGHQEDSDIDLVVVSDDFKDMDTWKRLTFLGGARIGIKKPMEILDVTEEEFKRENIGTFIGDEVKSKGIEI